MSKNVVDKAKRNLIGTEEGWYWFDFDYNARWSKENFHEFYRYFSHHNVEVRKYSLLVFAAGLGNWAYDSSHIFAPIKELKKRPDYDPDKEYYFEEYVKSFLDNSESIKKEFPLLYQLIIKFLIQLDNRKRFEYVFREVDKQLFLDLRQFLNESAFGEKIHFKYDEVMRELELK